METVKRIRTMRGMNQVDLAKASGVSQNTISEIETGRREARPATLGKLARALGVDIADFFDEPSYPKKARALSLRDTEPGTALPEDEVLYKATYTPDTFEDVLSESQEVIRDARRSYVIEGTLQLKLYMDDDSVEVRTEPVSPPSSRTLRRRRLTTKTRDGRETT